MSELNRLKIELRDANPADKALCDRIRAEIRLYDAVVRLIDNEDTTTIRVAADRVNNIKIETAVEEYLP